MWSDDAEDREGQNIENIRDFRDNHLNLSILSENKLRFKINTLYLGNCVFYIHLLNYVKNL